MWLYKKRGLRPGLQEHEKGGRGLLILGLGRWVQPMKRQLPGLTGQLSRQLFPRSGDRDIGE